jgi:pyruvate carboxylase subunit B
MSAGKKVKNPLKITDLTFRDGHQSLFATRVRTDDLAAIAPQMDEVGFWSMEVWGGATFDVMTRFLNEDPWERVRILKKLLRKTPLQMLLRGQNLVGYRNYADDVVQAFVEHAAECGIDVFRVFDAVNDVRNFESAFGAIRKTGKHIQGCLSYSLTQPRLGGPVYNIDYFVGKALQIQQMGADSFCIKDMAGLISPQDAYDLIKALKQALRIPVCLHSHYTSGMASMSMLKAAEAGADIIDTCIAPWALRTSHPAVEPIVVALQDTDRDTGLKLSELLKLGEYFESISPKYRDYLDSTKFSAIDTNVLEHQIPGGMFTNMVAQLREANALDRINEVYEELPRLRQELGYPPLVTPTSQIVGTQAIQNVLFGRYKMISGQVKDYCYGLYGQPPAPIDPKVQKMALKGYKRGERPITGRPADELPPEMEKARQETRDIARDTGDVLTYALYPQTGMQFLRWKYGLDKPPDSIKPKTMQDIRREDELMARARAGRLAEKTEAAPAKSVSELQAARHTEKAEPPKPAQDKAPGAEAVMYSPLPGTIVSLAVKVGDQVNEGDVVMVMEAMKMENELFAPVGGTIKALHVKPGDKVAADTLLAVIA